MRLSLLAALGLAALCPAALCPAALFLAVGPGAAQAAPIRIVDAADRAVTVDAPVDRVVVMFNYEEFTAIAEPAAWDKVVGYSRAPWADWRRSIWERYVAAVPRIGRVPDVGQTDDGSFSAEAVIALRPQAVLMARWQYDAIGNGIQAMTAAGIPIVVFDYNAQRLPTHLASTLAIGAVMGADARARDLADLYAGEIADIRARVARAGRPRPKVYVELADKSPDAIGNTYVTSMWGPMLEVAGGDNIAQGKVQGTAPLSAEYVLAARPDFIFLLGSSWPNAPKSVRLGYETDAAGARATMAPYAARPGWSSLPAVANGRVHALQHGLARSLFDFTAMQYIAKQLYPEPFADVDPEANLRRYHQRYLPIVYGGAWMVPLKP